MVSGITKVKIWYNIKYIHTYIYKFCYVFILINTPTFVNYDFNN